MRVRHGSNELVLNKIRQKYYIVGIRNALRSISHRCLKCRLLRARPRIPIMGPLPPGRVAYRQRPFSHCGIYYFGTMLVIIGRRREKRRGVLFTCLTTRAVHLELANSLSASSAIMAIQRLSARRGAPSVIYTDNGTNFRGASTELKSEIERINTDKQREYALQNGIKWVFIPPDAPRMGGAWEWLVRSVKVALRATLSEHTPTEEVLYTVLTEIEHSVNSRPLTYVSADPRDEEALTPNHFLIGASSGELKIDRVDAQHSCVKKQWLLARAFADAFWRRWMREYLSTLIERQKWRKDCQKPAVGDVVLIADYQAPRNDWRKGEIVEVYSGSDGTIRVAKVRTSKGDFVRAMHKLIPLFDRE